MKPSGSSTGQTEREKVNFPCDFPGTDMSLSMVQICMSAGLWTLRSGGTLPWVLMSLRTKSPMVCDFQIQSEPNIQHSRTSILKKACYNHVQPCRLFSPSCEAIRQLYQILSFQTTWKHSEIFTVSHHQIQSPVGHVVVIGEILETLQLQGNLYSHTAQTACSPRLPQ